MEYGKPQNTNCQLFTEKMSWPRAVYVGKTWEKLSLLGVLGKNSGTSACWGSLLIPYFFFSKTSQFFWVSHVTYSQKGLWPGTKETCQHLATWQIALSACDRTSHGLWAGTGVTGWGEWGRTEHCVDILCIMDFFALILTFKISFFVITKFFGTCPHFLTLVPGCDYLRVYPSTCTHFCWQTWLIL